MALPHPQRHPHAAATTPAAIQPSNRTRGTVLMKTEVKTCDHLEVTLKFSLVALADHPDISEIAGNVSPTEVARYLASSAQGEVAAIAGGMLEITNRSDLERQKVDRCSETILESAKRIGRELDAQAKKRRERRHDGVTGYCGVPLYAFSFLQQIEILQQQIEQLRRG